MRPSTRSLLVPIALALIALLVRALVAASRLDELELELYTGNLAWAWRHGMPLHPDQIPIINHLRGSAVFGFLAVPLYALLGDTLVALKTLSVLWSALGAFLFAFVLQRAAGNVAACIGGLLFAFAPPAQQMVEVMAMGSHADTLPFFLFALAVLLARPSPAGLGLVRTALFGMALGAGLLFSMQVWVALFGVLVVWWRVDSAGWSVSQDRLEARLWPGLARLAPGQRLWIRLVCFSLLAGLVTWLACRFAGLDERLVRVEAVARFLGVADLPAGEPLDLSLRVTAWGVLLAALVSGFGWLAAGLVAARGERSSVEAQTRLQGHLFAGLRRALLVAAFALPFAALIPKLSKSDRLVNREFDEWLLIEQPLAMFRSAMDAGESRLRAMLLALEDPLAKLATALGYELRRAWLYEEVGRSWVSWVLFAAMAAGLLYLLVRLVGLVAMRRFGSDGWALLATYGLLHIAALFAAYAILDFQVNLDATGDGMGSRYFMPLLPALIAAPAIALAHLARVQPRLALGLGALLVLSAAAGTAPLIEPRTSAQLPRVLGTEIHYFRDHLVHAGGRDLEGRLDWAERLSPHWVAFHPLAYDQLFPFHGPFATQEDIDARILRVRLSPERARPYLWMSLGFNLSEQRLFQTLAAEGQRALSESTLRQLQVIALGLEPEARVWFARGIGRTLAVLSLRLDLAAFRAGDDLTADDPIRAGLRLLGGLHPDLVDPIAQGMGFQIGMRLSPYKRLPMRAVDRASGALPEAAFEPFWIGLGWGLRMRFDEARYREPGPLRIEAGLDEDARAALRRGLTWQGPPDRP